MTPHGDLCSFFDFENFEGFFDLKRIFEGWFLRMNKTQARRMLRRFYLDSTWNQNHQPHYQVRRQQKLILTIKVYVNRAKVMIHYDSILQYIH